MNRRSILSMIGISPLALMSLQKAEENALANDLKIRWERAKDYTLAVLDAMPAEYIEYSPNENQLTFAQHFIHLSFFNVLFTGLAMDRAGDSEFGSLMQKDYLMPPPDDIQIFEADFLPKRSGDDNKQRVIDYIAETFDVVIAKLERVKDEHLFQGKEKPKPWFLEGHSNLDLLLRGENHTAHHRAQAIVYLRLKNAKPPGFGQYNTL